jgi:hypothetical protein
MYVCIYIYIYICICIQGGWWPCAELDEDFETYVWQLCPKSCNKCPAGGGAYTAPDIVFDGVAAPTKFVTGPVVLLRDAGGSEDGGEGDMLVVLHESPAPVGHTRALARHVQLLLKLEGVCVCVGGWVGGWIYDVCVCVCVYT